MIGILYFSSENCWKWVPKVAVYASDAVKNFYKTRHSF